MASFSPRALPCGLLLGLILGCAHGNATTRDGSGPAAYPSPDRGSIVTSDDLQRSPTDPIEKVLMSRVPGVWITRTPDGGISVRIRGASSLYANTEPLYIIDDIPITPGPNGSLAGINPYDIASIEVLKDAVGTAMYGVRGSNGVIIIKTKHPVQ
jgi:TonB-dependent SusC/RagA subfamily outer membrane receptor